MKKNEETAPGTPGSGERRGFLRNAALAGMAALFAPLTDFAAETVEEGAEKTAGNTGDSKNAQRITLLITTDIHAQLFPHDEFFWENNQAVFRKRGGMAVLKTMIEKLRKPNAANTIVYDGGDFFHGHVAASLTEGEAFIPLFNAMGYDLMLPGNWEVVYKKKKMLYDMGHSNAAKICANMFHQPGEGQARELVFPPYWVKYVAGVKIGMVGYTDHLIPKRQSPAYSVGLEFEHAEKSVKKYVQYLREVEGCAVVILATHMGLAQQVALANNPVCEGVDFIIGADTHERVRVPLECKYTRVVECGAFGSFLGKLELFIENGKYTRHTYELLDVDPAKYAPDKKIQQLAEQIYAPFKQEMDGVIGVSTTPLLRYFVLETPMDNLITDAVHWKFKPDFVVSNGFRFCQPLAVDPAKGKTEITKAFLWNMLPVRSELKIADVTGSQVLEWLEKELQNAFAKDPTKRLGGWFVRFSKMEVNVTIGNEYGKRVNHVKIGGQPLDPKKIYSMIACEREGDPVDTLCRMEHVSNPKTLTVNMHDAIIEYLQVHSPISPKLENRAVATDEPATLLTQLKGTTYEFR